MQDQIKKHVSQIKQAVEGKTLDLITRYEHLPEMDFKYMEDDPVALLGCHHGQRKLLMGEIQFYSCAPPVELVIYIGSAPCEHLPTIMNMFPDKKFLLIDPNYHAFNLDQLEFKNSNTVKWIYQNMEAVNFNNWKVHKNQQKHKPQFYTLVKNAQYMNARVTRDMFQSRVDFENKKQTALVKFTQQQKNNFYKYNGNMLKQITTSPARVFIIQDYLTTELIDLICENIKQDFLFVSDIRSTAFDDFPTDMDYLWNDALHILFLKKLQPMASMIKFHPPYFHNWTQVFDILDSNTSLVKQIKKVISQVNDLYGLDMIQAYFNFKHYFLDNVAINLQTWSPSTSTETRVIIDRDCLQRDFINYEHSTWDSHFMYLKMIRGYGYHDWFTKLHKQSDYDGCFDCSLEIAILANYFLQSGKPASWDMNLKQIKSQLGKLSDKIIKLKQQIDTNQHNPTDYKCPTHGIITKPANKIYVYQVVREKQNNWNYISLQTTPDPSKQFSKISYQDNNLHKYHTSNKQLLLADNWKPVSDKQLAKNFVK